VSSRLRLPALAVLAIAALPVLSACNTSPGSAALVGSQRITTGQLQSEVDKSLAGGAVQSQAGFSRTALTRDLLAHLISVDVLESLAAVHHVTVSTAEIQTQTQAFVKQAGSLPALQKQAAQNGISPSQLTGFIREDALESKLGTVLISGRQATSAQLAAEYKKDIDQYDKVDIAQIAVKSTALAKQILTKVRAHPGTFASLARKDSVDKTSAVKGGEVGLVPTSQVQQLLGATPVTAGTFELATASGDSVVLHIISHNVTPISDVTPQLNAAIFAAQEQAVLQKALVAQAAKLGVHVSPRYGKWDGATQTVVAVPSTISSGAPSPTATSSS
jgi:PPIC-type PPIASE domain/SurA N-terminal domain